MSDKFSARSAGLSSPGENAVEVSPSDAVDLVQASRPLYVGGAGDLREVTVSDDTVTFRNVAPGVLPIRVRRVLASGTTASDIVAVW